MTPPPSSGPAAPGPARPWARAPRPPALDPALHGRGCGRSQQARGPAPSSCSRQRSDRAWSPCAKGVSRRLHCEGGLGEGDRGDRGWDGVSGVLPNPEGQASLPQPHCTCSQVTDPRADPQTQSSPEPGWDGQGQEPEALLAPGEGILESIQSVQHPSRGHPQADRPPVRPSDSIQSGAD